MQRVIFMLMFMALGATTVTACSCFSDSHEKTFRKTRAIFVGKLVSIGNDEIRVKDMSPLRSLTFEVEKHWKGVGHKRITVLTNNPNMCSAFEFREGQSYLLYVRNIEGLSFVSSDCASSVEASSEAAQDRKRDLNSFWFRLRSRF